MSSSSRKIHPDDGDLGTARRIPDAKLGITSLDQASSELVEKGIIDQRRKSRAASTFIDEEKAALQGVNPASRAEREQLISALESGHTFLAFGIFNPRAAFKLCWDLMIVLLLIYTALSVPYSLAFDGMYCQTEQSYAQLTQAGLWIVDVLFWLDMLITFNTAIEDPFFPNTSTADMCTSRKSIAIQYVRSYAFFLDLVGNVPVQVIEHWVESGNGCSFAVLKALRLNRLVRLLRLMKLIRLTKIEKLNKVMHRVKDSLNIHPNHIRLAKLLLAIFTITHLMACFIYILTDWEAEYYSFRWATQLEMISTNAGLVVVRCPDIAFNETTDEVLSSSLSRLVDDPDNPGAKRIVCKRARDDGSWIPEAQSSLKYLISIYTIFTTLTSIGYGDIVMVTAPEYFVGIIVILVGASTFAVVVGSMASLLGKLDIRASAFKERMEDLDDFMHHENLPLDLRLRTRTFFEYGYNNTREIPGSINDLSSSLRTDVALSLHHDLITTVPFFQDCGKDFLTEIILRLKAQTLSPGDYLYEAGELGDSMYFLTKGSLEMVAHEQLGLICQVEEGSYVGESCVLGLTDQRQVSIRATTWCILFRLSMDALKDCIVRFPEAQEHFMKLETASSAESKMHKAAIQLGCRSVVDSPELLSPVLRGRGEAMHPHVVTSAMQRARAKTGEGLAVGSSPVKGVAGLEKGCGEEMGGGEWAGGMLERIEKARERTVKLREELRMRVAELEEGRKFGGAGAAGLFV